MFKVSEPWKRNLYSLWVAQFIAIMGMNLIVPFLPFYIRQLGVASEDSVVRWSGIVYAGPFFVSFLFVPFWGAMADRYGRKLMTVRAIFGLAISQALIGLATTVEMVFVFRIVQGAISGFVSAALALVSVTTPREKSGYAIGVLSSASSSGAVVGPMIGGSLADAFGYRPIFFIVAGLCTLAGFLVVRFVRETESVQPQTPVSISPFAGLRFTWRSPVVRMALIIIVVSQAAILMVQPIFTLFVESVVTNKEFLATVAGGIFSVAGLFMVLSAPWWGQRNDRHGAKKHLTYAIVGCAVAYAAQGFTTDAYQLIFFRALEGFCMGGILPALYSFISKHTPESRGGTVMGIASAFNILANMAGPTIGGLLAARMGLAHVFFVSAAILLSAAILTQFLPSARVNADGIAVVPTPPLDGTS